MQTTVKLHVNKVLASWRQNFEYFFTFASGLIFLSVFFCNKRLTAPLHMEVLDAMLRLASETSA